MNGLHVASVLICDSTDVKSDVVCVSLAARIMWRMDKQGSVVSDTQLISLEELEDHIYDISEDDLKDFKVDIHNFLDYWPRSSKPRTVDNVSHVLGVVRALTVHIIAPRICPWRSNLLQSLAPTLIKLTCLWSYSD